MRLRCAAVTLVLLSPLSARAQDEPATLTESEFIERYERAEPRLRLADADADRADAAVSEARRLANPELQVEHESVADSSETVAGVGIVLDLGGRGARVDSARSTARAARDDAARARWTLVVDALAAYYDTVRDRELVALLQDARAPLVEAAERLASQAEAGEAAGSDRDRIELALAQHDDRIADARAALAVSQERLGELVGAPESQVRAAATLAVAPPPALDSLTGAARDDARAAQGRVRAAEQAATAAGRWWIPRVTIAGGAKTVEAGAVEDTGFFVRLSLEVPVFDRNQAERERAAADRRRGRAAADRLALAIRGELRRAHTALTAALDRLDTVEREQVPRADRLVDRATLVFREGEGEVTELLTAHATALDVRERRLELQHRAKHRELDLWRAYGARPPGESP